MMRSLSTAAAGMIAQQFNIDVISNNLANVNTSGFKQSRAEFQDLLYQNLRGAGSSTGSATIPNSTQVGLGARPISTVPLFTEGALQVSENPYDLAIQGDGFFKVLMPDGTTAYTRDGSFKRDGQGNLVTSDGYPLEPNVNIPADAISDSLSILPDGTVNIRRVGSDGAETLTTLTLTTFINPAGLDRIGQNLYRSTSAAGPATDSQPGQSGAGTIAQKALEQSNVQVVEEMVKLIQAQRAYEINSKAIQASDEMMGIANNVKR